jgi:DNA-binding transcriptional ArsR family regulator
MAAMQEQLCEDVVTSKELDVPAADEKYVIFQALSHPLRVKMLIFIDGNELTFSSLKQRMGMESSGQLQHHLRKLSGLVVVKANGNYGLTDAGRSALDLLRESESSGTSLEALCCVPTPKERAWNHQVGNTGIVLRLAIGVALSAATIALLVSYFLAGSTEITLLRDGSYFASLGIDGAVLFGFFGISFLISAVTGYPGCEITAIPNLFAKKKWYCSCLITPFNVPNGRLLEHERRLQ